MELTSGQVRFGKEKDVARTKERLEKLQKMLDDMRPKGYPNQIRWMKEYPPCSSW